VCVCVCVNLLWDIPIDPTGGWLNITVGIHLNSIFSFVSSLNSLRANFLPVCIATVVVQIETEHSIYSAVCIIFVPGTVKY